MVGQKACKKEEYLSVRQRKNTNIKGGNEFIRPSI